jgi:hypothetical protein
MEFSFWALLMYLPRNDKLCPFVLRLRMLLDLFQWISVLDILVSISLVYSLNISWLSCS